MLPIYFDDMAAYRNDCYDYHSLYAYLSVVVVDLKCFEQFQAQEHDQHASKSSVQQFMQDINGSSVGHV